jgi:hypothetical protein
MAHRLELGERELWNSLTVLKLSLQILERRTKLSPQQQKLVSRALGATDCLSASLARAPASRGHEPANGHARLAAPDQATRAAGRVSFPALFWRYAWPLGKRVLAGTTRLVLASPLSGLRGRARTGRVGQAGRT